MVDQIIRPADLPDRPSPVASEKIPVDNGVTVGGATIQAIVNAGRPLASEAEAVAGVEATKAMTPLTTKQAIQSQGDARFASSAQGSLADTAVQPGSLAAVATSGAYADLTGAPPALSDGDKGDIVVSSSGTEWIVSRRFNTVSILLLDTSMGYGVGTQVVAVGDIVTAQGFPYEVAASGATDNHVETAGGVKLYLAGDYVSPAMIGDLSGVVDDVVSTAIRASAELAVPMVFPSGTYQFLKAVDFSPLLNGASHIHSDGDVVFDFTTASSLSNFPNAGFVYLNGGSLVPLPGVSADLIEGGYSVEFSSAHGLQSGNRFCIFNPTNGSYTTFRDYYHAGEWCRVATVSGSTSINIEGQLYDGYVASAVDLYKHPNKSISITGGTITILESADSALDGVIGFRADRIVDSDFSLIRPTNSGNAGIGLTQCIGITGSNYNIRQNRVTTAGTSYALVLGNCQDVVVSGIFEGGRHAVAGGGSTGPGSVPCRSVDIRGIARNGPNALAGDGAFNTHGNCEFWSFEGLVDGGLALGGNRIRVRGIVRTKNSQAAALCQFNELAGTDFDLQGVRFIGNGNPSAGARGVVDVGGNSTNALNEKTKRGGVLNFDGCVFECPTAQVLFKAVNRGYVGTEKVIISADGAKWLGTSHVGSVVMITDKSGSRPIDHVSISGFINSSDAPWAIATDTLVRGWRDGGLVTITPSTALNGASAAVTYKHPSPRASSTSINLTLASATVGGKTAVPYATTPTSTGFTANTITCDTAVYANTNAAVVRWLSAVDEW